MPLYGRRVGDSFCQMEHCCPDIGFEFLEIEIIPRLQVFFTFKLEPQNVLKTIGKLKLRKTYTLYRISALPKK